MFAAKSVKLVDDLFEQQKQIGHMYYVKHPGKQVLLARLRAIVGVLTGRFVAVKFAEKEKEYDKEAKKKDSAYVPVVKVLSEASVQRAKEEVYKEIAEKELGLEIDEFKQVTNVGRNEPCPCRSGLKFKKCHGKLE
jgi:uncharacterized protein YchJ